VNRPRHALIVDGAAEQELEMTQELVVSLHGIGPPHDGVPTEEVPYWVTHEQFKFFLNRVVAAQATVPVSIVITFDDGNLSDATIALPELAKRGLKAAFFICAGRIGERHYLDRSAVGDLLQAGMEVGTHGMHHRDWRELDDEALDLEVGDARRRIADLCGGAITSAAIPFGSYDRRVLGRLRQENLTCVYSSDQGLARREAWLKPRVTVDCSWQAIDIDRMLAAPPSLKARLRRDVAMLVKALR
jgi:peptidoglycan/xylan/chitin deacetylase (PgdA/CDA1 family)